MSEALEPLPKAIGGVHENPSDIQKDINSISDVKSGIFDSLKRALGFKGKPAPPTISPEDDEIKVMFLYKIDKIVF